MNTHEIYIFHRERNQENVLFAECVLFLPEYSFSIREEQIFVQIKNIKKEPTHFNGTNSK